MNKLNVVIGASAFLALAAFAFSPPADARNYERGGDHRHHRGGGGGYYRGPRVSIGFIAPILPVGHVRVAVGGRPYYYHGGHFYRHGPRGYVVVAAPLGASVVTLPTSAVQVQVGGIPYYQYANSYYQWHPASRSYVVVAPPAPVAVVPAPIAVVPAPAPVVVAAAPVSAPATVPATPNPGPEGFLAGQVVETLPKGYAAEIINGIQYYRYGGNYFMPTQRDGHEVYVVVKL
ncbi:DUF6515 family protein [Microbulbifer sp. OS29]|uniref:DUF6515 family protein n=1 Tax=Microbulbifer okhotskensis TaxID=2926617 RepID=A0A9X2EM78_9GAMM|nr:DUF6515 family protein [Microbulbifer okhotskensis]MCO1334150.1 DUF6515 family protein [Microbulbifer okhotskensis]